MASEIRVVLADDHEELRGEIRSDLEGEGFAVVAEARDADGAVAAALRERPELVLLDVEMPGGGIPAAAAISARLPDAKVVVLTATRDEQVAVDALAAGASGYVLKDVSPERLGHTLRAVLDGEYAYAPRLLGLALAEIRRREKASGPLLSAREWSVAELLARGAWVPVVADRLGLPANLGQACIAAIARALRGGGRARVTG